NLSLITLGSNTLQIAIPNPIKNVPKNKKTIVEIDRKLIPINRTHKPNINARSLVNLLANLGAIGEINIKAIKGKLVNKAIFQFANPTSSRIVPISGPIEVIARRKLKAIISYVDDMNI